MELRTVTVRDTTGEPVELTAVEAGADTPGAVPLLIHHGFTGSKENWTTWYPWVDELAQAGFHVVAPDVRGHGASPGPADPARFSLEIYAHDVFALVDELGWDRFVLWGHSMGGMAAQLAALERPEQVVALVLQDTHHGAVDIDPDLVSLAVAVVEHDGMDAFAEMSAEMQGPLATPAHQRMQDANPEYVEFGDRQLRASSPAMYVTMARAMTTAPDRLAALRRLATPALVVVGEQDTPFLMASARMAAAMPTARLAIVAHAGHSPQIEAPHALGLELWPFLHQVRRTWEAREAAAQPTSPPITRTPR